MLLALLLLIVSARAEWEPVPDIAEPFNTGVLALQAGRPADAEQAFRAALADDPDCGRCAHGLGIALVRQERLAEARDILEDAALRYAERAELHTALAGASFAAQDFGAALTHARTAVSLQPDSIDAQVALQQVLLRLGQLDQARAALADASTLPGPERSCLAILRQLEAGTSPEDSALAYCRQAAHPGLATTVDARLGLAEARPGATAAASSAATSMQLVVQALRAHQAGDDRAALPLLDRALSLEPRRVDARILRAVARARTGALDDAVADLHLVMNADTWVEVHATGEMSGVLTRSDQDDLRHGMQQGSGLLVSLLVQSGRLDQAEQTLVRANRELGMGPRLASGAVRLRSAQGRLDDAWAVLDGALAQWPDDNDLGLLVTELAAQDPDRVPAAHAARLAAADDWRARYHRAQALARDADHAACAAQAEQSLRGLDAQQPPASVDDHTTVARLAHTCAVNAGLLTAADRAADAVGHPGALQPVARINHALMREDVGDHQGALDLLADLQPADAAARNLAANVTVYAAGELSRWDQALAAAPHADADVALWLALRLRDAGLDGQARQATDGRCDDLSGPLADACRAI